MKKIIFSILTITIALLMSGCVYDMSAVNTPTPTVMATPIINASPTPIANASPSATTETYPPDYNDYLSWKTNQTATDNGTYGVPITGINNATGLPYYNPLATPTPTPAPEVPWNINMVHQTRNVNLNDLGYTAEENSYLTFVNTGDNQTGIYPYYSIGDHPVFHPTFQNTNPNTVTNPILNITILGVDNYGQTYTWYTKTIIINSTIPAMQRWTCTYDPGLIIPSYYSSNGIMYPIQGTYILQVTIYASTSEQVLQGQNIVTIDTTTPLDWISRQVTILPNEMI